MRPAVALTLSSLLSMVLFSFHWADEISRGMESGQMGSIGGLASSIWGKILARLRLGTVCL